MDVRMASLASCLQERGFPAEVGESSSGQVGRLSFERIPQDQFEQLRETMTECRRDLGFDMDPPPLTREQHAARYEAGVSVHGCLREHDIPSDDPPSFDVYVENDGRWLPGSRELNEDRPMLRRAVDVCPRLNEFIVTSTDE